MKSDDTAVTHYGKVSTALDVGRVIRAKRREIGVRQDTAAMRFFHRSHAPASRINTSNYSIKGFHYER
jgi:hypothetical protein